MPNIPKKPKNATLKIIDECLNYFPISGILIWTKPKSFSVKVGQPFGATTKGGYRAGNVNKQPIKAHHICWYKFYGEWPSLQLDHRNNIRDDNRIRNLREVTDKQNRHNAKANKTNKTGEVGITFLDKWRKKKYHVDIFRNGIRLSSFHYTLEEAKGVRDEFFALHNESGA